MSADAIATPQRSVLDCSIKLHYFLLNLLLLHLLWPMRDRYASKKRARVLGPTHYVPSALASSSSAFGDGAADPCVVNNRCVSRNESSGARYASMDTSNKAALLTHISDRQAALRVAKSSNIHTDASVASSSTYDVGHKRIAVY